MIIKVLNQGKGKVKNAVDYVFNQSKHKGQEISLIYGDRSDVVNISKTIDFNRAVKKWKYFSVVVSFTENESSLLNKETKSLILDQFNRFITENGSKDVPYVVVEHKESKSIHWHIIGLRYDLETGSFHNPFKPGFENKFELLKAFLNKEINMDMVESKKTIAEHVFADTKEYMKRVRDEVLDKAVKQDPDVFKKVNVKHNEFVKEMQGKTKDEVKDRYFQLYPENKEYEPIRPDEIVDPQQEYIKLREDMKKYKQVNLVGFIVSHGGKILSRSTSKIFRVGFQNSILLVNQKGEDWLYYDVNKNEGGSIFDFCEKYLDINNFGIIKRKIQEYLDNSQSKDPLQLAPIQNNAGGPKKEFSLSNYTKIFNKVQHPLWRERKINPYLLRRYLDDIYTDQKNNLCFPIYNQENQIVGFEVKNINHFKGNVGSKQGFSMLKPVGTDFSSINIAVVGESMIDCLSYAILTQAYKEDVVFLSTSGVVGETHLEMLKKLKEKGFSFILVFDNDEQGKKYTQEVINAIGKEYCIVQTPKNKDWNDDLMEQWRIYNEEERE
ncbi:MAG: toprim domain-containing protein [Thermoproteota archaeon]